MSESHGEKPDPKEAVADALVKRWADERWAPYLELLGLHDVEASERMNRILVMHLLLDRAVTAILTTQLVDRSPTYAQGDFTKIEAILTFVDMEDRIDLAKVSHLISETCASDMKTLNTLRNKLAHYEPKHGWGVGHIQELSSIKAYEQCIEKGFRALGELVPALMEKLKQVP